MKLEKLAESRMMTKRMKMMKEICLAGFLIFSVSRGNRLAKNTPRATGIPNRMKTVWTTCQKSISIGRNNSAPVFSYILMYRSPQKAKLAGVITMAIMVEKAVIETDSAIFPFAREVMKLETFPPGQAATRIIPNATDGVGFRISTSRKVPAGNNIN